MGDDTTGKFTIEFIDPLFAVAIHLGLSHGIFRELWFKEWRVPMGDEVFRLWVFGLGLLSVILAWLGYHRSIQKRPIRAFGRFIIDVILVMLYAALLVKYADFRAALLILVVIFALYVLWDLLKTLEYRPEYAGVAPWRWRYAGEFVTFTWFVVFSVLYLSVSRNWVVAPVALFAAYAFTIAHRINKLVPIWSALGDAFVRLFVRGPR